MHIYVCVYKIIYIYPCIHFECNSCYKISLTILVGSSLVKILQIENYNDPWKGANLTLLSLGEKWSKMLIITAYLVIMLKLMKGK
jgi:hypothetical protein